MTRDLFPGKLPCVCGCWIESSRLKDLRCPLCGEYLVYSCTLRGIARAEESIAELRGDLAHLTNTARVEHLPEVAALTAHVQGAIAKVLDDVRALREAVRETAAKRSAA